MRGKPLKQFHPSRSNMVLGDGGLSDIESAQQMSLKKKRRGDDSSDAPPRFIDAKRDDLNFGGGFQSQVDN